MEKAQPTNAELEILAILWKKEKATVREVYEAISLKKKCVYTSTLKIMQKMHTKGLIGRDIQNQKHDYYALVEETNVRNGFLTDIINRFFKGSYKNLALHALGKSSSEDNMDEILEIINKLKTEKE